MKDIINMKNFGIFKKVVDTVLYSYYKRDEEGKLIHGDYYLIIPDSWYSIDNNKFEFLGTGNDNEQLPSWLVDLVENTCPTCERGMDDVDNDEFWISDNEIENLRKLATDYNEFIDDSYNLEPPRTKHWFDVTEVYKLKNLLLQTKNKQESRLKVEYMSHEITKRYDKLKRLVKADNCKISLYKEPSTDNRYLCVEPPADYDLIMIDPDADVLGKDLQEIPLYDTFNRYDKGVSLGYNENILLSFREDYLKELMWAEKFHI